MLTWIFRAAAVVQLVEDLTKNFAVGGLNLERV
jgi:hypothetical protein